MVKKKEEHAAWFAARKITLGIALFIAGFIFWISYDIKEALTWTFIVLGLLSILKGSYCYFSK